MSLYIDSKKQRVELDTIVEDMALCLNLDGDLGYLLFAFCLRHVPKNYNDIKNFLGELNECSMEIRRRILSKVENQAMRNHGDIGE